MAPPFASNVNGRFIVQGSCHLYNGCMSVPPAQEILSMLNRSVIQDVQTQKRNEKPGASQNFNQIFGALMLGSRLFSGNKSEAGSLATSAFSGSDQTILSSLLVQFIEQMLSRAVNDAQEQEPKEKSKDQSRSEETLASIPKKRNIATIKSNFAHINQFKAEIQAGGDGRNANCGPTSLTMGLHALGLRVLGETEETSSGKAVDLARKSMCVDAARDGVDSTGRRVESEHSTFTNFTDLARGAKAAGARIQFISPNAVSIKNALLKNGKVIISGTFVGKSPLPWTGDRGGDNQSAPGGATAHIVAITGYDEQRGTFTVNDPARLSSLEVDGAALNAFMRGNAGALAIYRAG